VTRSPARSLRARARAVRRLGVAVGVAMGLGGCAAGPARSPLGAGADGNLGLRRTDGRPPLAVVVRDGDPRGAIAVAVVTEGIAAERGAEVPVALAAVVESRVAKPGEDKRVNVLPTGDGFRARGLASNEAEAAALAQALEAALLAPITAADLPPVQRKLAMLARRPLGDAALDVASRCEASVLAPPSAHGAAAATGSTPATDEGVTVETLEAWRRAAIGLGRVSMATAGREVLGDAVAKALAAGPTWPTGASIGSEPPAPSEARTYDATGDVATGGARVTLATRTARAEDAVQAAEALGNAGGALAARLGGLDAPAKLRDVTAAAHAHGGCLVVSFDFAPRDLVVDLPARVATAIALARQEITTEIGVATGASANATGPANVNGATIARRAGDPRDAADLAAWWALSTPDSDVTGEPRIAASVGLTAGREAGGTLKGTSVTVENGAVTSRADAIRTELDRAIVAWHEPVVEARTQVEKGQGDLWLAFGSPCGTLAEMETDAGLGAAFALAAADRTTGALRGTGASAEAWAAPDGIGVVVHGPPLAGESPEAHARRLADAVGRSFAAEPVDRASVSHARARLLGEDGRGDARALVSLASAIAPGHPSWIAPMGPVDALGRSSDSSVVARASALRAGPLRLAVLANATPAQSDAAVRAVDRWIARQAGQSRACPLPSSPAAPRSATYAVDAPAGSSSEAWLALALPPGDATAQSNAEWIAATLDGPDGLLAHALGSGLARAWSARVVGGPHASALVVRVDSAAASLDAAVAQVRALFDRLRQGSLGAADQTHAATLLGERDLAGSLDPSRRVLNLWRGAIAAAPPTLDALRSFASTTLRDDALIIVAVRPPHAPSPPSERATPPPKGS
jgi:hypothetical protein